jgi:hypothetical protein
MDFSKYVEEDLDNDLEAIFADMMDEGFEINKNVSTSKRMFHIRITRRTPSGLSFDIMSYKDYIKQLFDVFQRRGVQFFEGFIYIDNSQKPLKDVTSLLNSDGVYPLVPTDFTKKTFDDMWEGLSFSIYCASENDTITNLTMTFYEK